ncbi:MAG: response regulator transcription factor [Bacteroidota bacterium]
MPIKVSIVEDIADIRESLATLINGSHGFSCISSYGTGAEALSSLLRDKPDVVLMDINLPDTSGIDCVRELRNRGADFQVLMLTMYEDSDQVFKALAAGASGYLLKRTPPAKLLEAIHEVLHGGSPMSMQIARMVVQSFHSMGKSSDEKMNLTRREEEILAHLAKGLRYKEIADALFINIETVRSHLRRIYEKLHVRSRTEAVVKYLQK